MVPAATAADLDDVHRELLAGLGQPDEFLRCASRARDRSEAVSVDPGHERQLLFAADRTRDLAPPAVELRRPQQVWVGVAHFGDVDTARIDVGQQRSAPKRVVDHLPLDSHVTRVAVHAVARAGLSGLPRSARRRPGR